MSTDLRPGRLLFVDLNCSRPMRVFVRTVARVHAWRRALLLGLGGLLGASRADTVLVSAEPGSAPHLRFPSSMAVRLKTEFESEESVAEVMRWTTEATANLLEASHHLPPHELCGVNLWQLARLPLQSLLLDHAACVSVLRTAANSVAFEGCDILTGDRNEGRALVAEAAAAFPRARRVMHPAFALLDSTRQLAKLVGVTAGVMRRLPKPGTPVFQALPGDAKVLIVSESRPMSLMFAAVERALQGLTDDRVVRLQYGNPDPESALESPSHVVDLPFDFSDADVAFVDAIAAGRSEPGAASVPDPVQAIAGRVCAMPLKHLPAFGRQWFPRVAGHVLRAKQVLDQFSPSLVVVGNDRWYVGQAFVQLARQRGIATLGLQDGISTDVPEWAWISADYFAMSGMALYDHLVAHGVSPSRLTITGQPRYDDLATLATPAARAQARRSLGTTAGEIVVTFATQPGQDFDFISSVIRGILMVPDVHLIVRPHPSGDSVDAGEIARAFPAERYEVRRNDPVQDLLFGTDVLVTQHSTVAVEAAILGLPVITVDFAGSAVNVPYAKLGISLEARSADDIARNLQRILDDSAYRARTHQTKSALEYLTGPQDGRAAERVAKLIVELLLRPFPAGGGSAQR